MKILITGIAGYIGSAVAKLGVEKGHHVVGLDSLDDTLYPDKVKQKRLQELRADYGVESFALDPAVNSLEKLPLEECDVVINEMAIPGLAPSWSSFQKYMHSNVVALQILLEAIVMRNPEVRIVHASTSSVYGNTSPSGELSPLSPYGVSKLAAENLLGSYEKEYELDIGVLRYFSVYGDVQRPDMAYSKFIKNILAGDTITIFGDGNQTRTNTHVSDVAKATLLAAEKTRLPLTVDISGSEEVRLIDSLKMMEQIIGKRAQLVFSEKQRGDQRSSRGKIEPAKDLLGWLPKVNFVDGLADQIEKTRLSIEQ